MSVLGLNFLEKDMHVHIRKHTQIFTTASSVTSAINKVPINRITTWTD